MRLERNAGTGSVAALCVALTVGLLTGARPVLAADAPTVTSAAGMVEVSFPLPEGAAIVFIPDDIAAGEAFSGTLEAPTGFVLGLGAQRAQKGLFSWRVPSNTSDGLLLVLRNERGVEQGRVSLRTPAGKSAAPSFRFPRLVQAGQPFPIHGPFDGDARTTHVSVGGAQLSPIAESVRKAIAWAPMHLVGPISGEIRETGRAQVDFLRTLSIDMTASEGGAVQQLIVKGLAGFDRDVPFVLGRTHFYVRAEEIPGEGVLSVRRTFSGAAGDSAAKLLIPQSRLEEVAVVLRTPRRGKVMARAMQQAEALRALDFDVLPVMSELFPDSQIGGDAAFAALALDEVRALRLLFGSMPESGPSIQLIAFDWFIGRPAVVRSVAAAEAHEAALRVLRSVLSSTTAELALYVVGLTGTPADFPLLQRFHETGGLGTRGLREASEAALMRLGSRPHLDGVRTELAEPLAETTSSDDGVRLARALRKAGFAARRELLPEVCGYVGNRTIVDIDIAVEIGGIALSSLAAIVDGTPTSGSSPRRSLGEWQAYCGALEAP